VRVLSSHTPLLASMIHTRTGTYLLEVLSPKYYFSQVRSLEQASVRYHRAYSATSSRPPSAQLTTQIKVSVRPEVEDDAGKILCLEYKYPGTCCLVFSSHGISLSFIFFWVCVSFLSVWLGLRRSLC